MDLISIKKKNFFNSFDLEKQEHLSFSRLKKISKSSLSPEEQEALKKSRPKSSFIDLISWVESSFVKYLPKNHGTTRFVHNKILLDGQFTYYCEMNDISIECLLNDSVVSWQTDSGSEKYFLQGVFKISSAKFSFLHAALYHKGNQYEDEVSFINIVPDQYYSEYLELRNSFESWSRERDRSSLQVHVVGGDDFDYDKNLSWDSLFLPDNVKQDIKSSIETFLLSEKFYKDNNIPWRRGILLHGPPGTGKTLCIRTIISNYNFKPVTMFPATGDEGLKEAFSYAEQQNPALLYFEDLDNLFANVNMSLFLNLLDGVSAKNGVLIVATTNDIDKFHSNLIDRPSRFDRKYKIPLPDRKMTLKFLKAWFKNFIPEDKLKVITETCVRNKFSYAYLKELYVSSFYSCLNGNRKTPTLSDVNLSLEKILSDKESVGINQRKLGLDQYL